MSYCKSRKGMILVAAVGVLGVLSVMGLSFATVMRIEAHAASRFSDAVRAEFAARAGLEDAIARLRVMARLGAERPIEDDGTIAAWYTWRGARGGGGRKISFPAKSSEALKTRVESRGGRRTAPEVREAAFDPTSYSDWVGGTYIANGDNYVLRVEDAASKININAGDNLGLILDNLCRAIGPPLRPADQRALVPSWFAHMMQDHEIGPLSTSRYESEYVAWDSSDVQDLFYTLGPDGRPVTERVENNVGIGPAVFGDGYAIAGYRARNGPFLSIEEVKNALTYIERGDRPNGVPDLVEERMEIEAKFAALRPYITIDSWTDTTQIGYGKLEHFVRNEDGKGQRLTDRNKTWNIRRNWNMADGVWDGELAGCFLAIINGPGQGQIKRIARNTIDTLWLDDNVYPGSEVYYVDSERHLMPTPENSYMIIGRDFIDLEEQRLYQRQPLSFHRAPVNVNTAADKVLVAVLMGLQTTWGPSGYPMYLGTENLFRDVQGFFGGTQTSLCPAVISLGRDYTNNSILVFPYDCPNEDCRTGCFFCNYRRKAADGHGLNEAHLIAWEILKEREETPEEDRRAGDDGHGPFRGWDDLYFRVFRKFDLGRPTHVRNWDPRARGAYERLVDLDFGVEPLKGKRGLSRVAMANFNSNTNILKFQPNLEWINRWGANFTDLYLPYPQLLNEDLKDNQGRDIGGNVKLRVRPGELIDKTDLNIGTTEFTFDSGGVFEIESVGRVYDERGLVASRRLSVLVKVYDVWRESTQRQFVRGTIMNAEGSPGSENRAQARTAGQVAVDGYTVTYDVAGRPVESTAPARRKALMTYPEPITPKGHLTSNSSREAALNVGRSGVHPAGYDGQIMLATNNMAQGGSFVTPNVSFYASFSGDMAAEYSGSNAEPNVPSGVWAGQVQPLDVWVDLNENGKFDHNEPGVGLLGIIDSLQVDVQPLVVSLGDGFTMREGEGPGGDLRPDGIFFGATGRHGLDGSIEWDNKGFGAFKIPNSTVTMWVKPMWHHGTVIRSSLPLAYRPEQAVDRGTNVVMRNYDMGWYDMPGELEGARLMGLRPRLHPVYRPTWNSEHQKYETGKQEYEYKRNLIGFVRSRFESELFNAARLGVRLNDALDFRLVKFGDWHNSFYELNNPSVGSEYRLVMRRGTLRNNEFHTAPAGAPPFGGLHAALEDGVHIVASHIPGHLYGDGTPFYSVAPFRWHYAGISWVRGDSLGRYGTGQVHSGGWERTVCRKENWGSWDMYHQTYGQPVESSIAYGFPFYRDGWGLWTSAKPWMPPGMLASVAGNSGEPALDGHWYELPPENSGADRRFPANGGGRPVVPDHLPDRTAEANLSLVMVNRPFISTMRTWGRTPHSDDEARNFPSARNTPALLHGVNPIPTGMRDDNPGPLEARLRSWAYEQYTSMTEDNKWPPTASTNLPSPGGVGYGHVARDGFGLNRGRTTGKHVYQRLYSGTYAVLDEYTIYNFSPDVEGRDYDLRGFRWPYRKYSVGRYYTATGSQTRPWFRSQSLFNSERAQGYVFTHDDERDKTQIELGTVRWTAYTPYYAVHVPNNRQWTFPYESYFREVDGQMLDNGRHTNQSWRHPPHMWRHDKRLRISPQRGCRVQIVLDSNEGGQGGRMIPGDGSYFDDQEAWAPIRDPRADHPGQHVKATPGEVRYRVTFQLSDEEERMLNESNAALIDSPVFDDITITYLRRPKIIEWRE